MNDGMLLALFAAFTALSALFSAAETSLTSLSASSLFRLREEGHPGAERLARLRDRLERTIGAILVGNTLANAAVGSISAALAIPRLGEQLGVVVATVGTTAFLLVLAEVTPKTLAARRPEEIALLLARPVEFLVRLLSPVATLIAFGARPVLGLFGAGAASGGRNVTEADVRSLISLSERQGSLDVEEKEILHAVLDFGDLPVREAMVPLARTVTIPVTATFTDVEAACREHRYSRFPVTGDSLDDIVGVLHAKDLYDVSDAEERTFVLSRWIRPAVFVPELKRASDLFRDMRRHRFHLAVVLDEHGSTAGVVTLEDLVERILGDISDEHDEPLSRPLTEGTTLLVEGAYRVTSLERDLGVSLDEPGVESVAGLLLKRLGRIPRAGAKVRIAGLEFAIERASARAILRVRISRMAEQRSAAKDGGPGGVM